MYLKSLTLAYRIFIPRERSIEKAKQRCRSFIWGGRREQDLVAKMREEGSRLRGDTELGIATTL